MKNEAIAETFVIDTRSGARSVVADWIAACVEIWQAPRERPDRLMALLHENVVLKAPTTPPMTRGKTEGRRAFARAFRAMPDLCAEVHRWCANDDVLFIEMSFFATIGGRTVTWRNVDRFLFQTASRLNALLSSTLLMCNERFSSTREGGSSWLG